MGEIHNDNPETKSPSSEVSQPEPAKVSDNDKEKLSPQENGAAKSSKDASEGNTSNHPKLESTAPGNEQKETPNANNGKLENNATPGNEVQETPSAHSKLENTAPGNEQKETPNANNGNLENTTPGNEQKETPNANNGNLENTTPERNEDELSPYAKGKLDNFPKDAPEEIRPAYERACAAEPKITKDMEDVTAGTNGGHLEGLEHRLKDGDSYVRKVNKVSDTKGIMPEDVANNMHDINRYTQVSDGDHLVENANNTLASLKEKGYSIDDVNSTWSDDSAYKGINCKLTSPEGQPCELQFHTPESLATKEQTHGLYEAQRELSDGSPERDAYEDKMREISAPLTPPKGIENLRTNYD